MLMSKLASIGGVFVGMVFNFLLTAIETIDITLFVVVGDLNDTP